MQFLEAAERSCSEQVIPIVKRLRWPKGMQVEIYQHNNRLPPWEPQTLCTCFLVCGDVCVRLADVRQLPGFDDRQWFSVYCQPYFRKDGTRNSPIDPEDGYEILGMPFKVCDMPPTVLKFGRLGKRYIPVTVRMVKHDDR